MRYENWAGTGVLKNELSVTQPDMLAVKQLCKKGNWEIWSQNNSSLSSYLKKHKVKLKEGNDLRYWPESNNGELTAKIAYNKFRIARPYWRMHKHIWMSSLPLKVSVFSWKLWFKAIKLDGDLQEFGIPLVNNCSCCLNPQLDYMEHLFGNSEIIEEVWNSVARFFGFNYNNNLNWRDYVNAWCNNFKSQTQFHILVRHAPFLIMWELWLRKLAHKYEGRKMSAETIITKVMRWLKHMSLKFKPKKNSSNFEKCSLETVGVVVVQCKVKRPIYLERLKLNIDGSAYGYSGEAGCGGILRNDKRDIVFAFAQCIGKATNMKAEMLALLFGLQICYQLNQISVDIETDSEVLANWWRKQSMTHIQYTHIWEGICYLKKYVGEEITHVYREQNDVADS